MTDPEINGGCTIGPNKGLERRSATTFEQILNLLEDLAVPRCRAWVRIKENDTEKLNEGTVLTRSEVAGGKELHTRQACIVVLGRYEEVPCGAQQCVEQWGGVSGGA